MTSDVVGGMAGLRGAAEQAGRGNGVGEAVFQTRRAETEVLFVVFAGSVAVFGREQCVAVAASVSGCVSLAGWSNEGGRGRMKLRVELLSWLGLSTQLHAR